MVTLPFNVRTYRTLGIRCTLILLSNELQVYRKGVLRVPGALGYGAVVGYWMYAFFYTGSILASGTGTVQIVLILARSVLGL